MVSIANMTDVDLARADKIIENAFELMRDIIANPAALEHVPSHSAIEVIPVANASNDEQVVARTA